MTDAEIMKGLACCGKPNSCVDCNFGKLKGEDCIMVLANNAVEKPSEFTAEKATVDFLNGLAHRQHETLDIIDNLVKEMTGEKT